MKCCALFLSLFLCANAQVAGASDRSLDLQQLMRGVEVVRGASQGVTRDRVLDPLHSPRLAYGLVQAPELQQLIDPVLQQLRQAAGTAAPEAQVHITADPAFSAYALGGGHIFLAAGLLSNLDSQDELAAVLAHEYVHVWRGHTGQTTSERLQAAFTGLSALYLDTRHGANAVERNNPDASFVRHVLLREAAMRSLQSGVIPQHSRQQEEEADREGVELMRRAGFNPSAMVDFLDKLESFHEQQSEPQPSAKPKRLQGVAGMVSRLAGRNDSVSELNRRSGFEGTATKLIDGLLQTGMSGLRRAQSRHPRTQQRIDRVIAQIDSASGTVAHTQMQPIDWDGQHAILVELEQVHGLLAAPGSQLLFPENQQKVQLQRLAAGPARDVPLVRYALLRYMRAGQPRAEAVAELQRELERPDSLLASHQLILELVAGNSHEQAAQLYKSSLRSFNDSPELIPYGIRLYRRAGKPDLARTELARCIAVGDEALGQICRDEF